MKITRLAALAASTLLYLFVGLPTLSTQNNSAPFDESYRLAQSLPDSREHIVYLIELCHKSRNLNAPAEKIKEWSSALFKAASMEQDVELRAIGQKNAATCLSYIDPDAAMDLLSQVDFQHPASGQWVGEDPRSNAAEEIFNNFLDEKKPQSFSVVIEQARSLGKSGQYPYWAMSKVVLHNSPSPTKDEVKTIFQDALTSYNQETGFYDRDEEFLYLLGALENSAIETVVDKDLASRLVATFVQRLQNAPLQFPGDYYAEIHVPSKSNVFPFTDRNAAFLFQAFATIRKYNWPLAKQLSQQNPQLNQAAEDMSYVSGGFVLSGDPRSQQAAEKHLELLQTSLIRKIRSQQDCNPEVAAQLAQRLTDPSLRIVGFSAAIQGLAKSNRSDAQAIYENQVSELNDLGSFSTDSPSSLGRLRAMVALAAAANSLGERYQERTTQAFDLGVDLYQSDVNAHKNDVTPRRVQNRAGFAELQDLVTFAASQPTNALQLQIDHLPKEWLKAYLLLYVAEGQAKLKPSSFIPKPCGA